MTKLFFGYPKYDWRYSLTVPKYQYYRMTKLAENSTQNMSPRLIEFLMFVKLTELLQNILNCLRKRFTK